MIAINRRRTSIVGGQRQARIAMVTNQQIAKVFCAAHGIFRGNPAIHAQFRTLYRALAA